ncbi:hypothetical protein RFI_09368 [Reticulomyxa filosa]|uniref:Uncharacterized protein n=1 Tax=Reticulomyxa filosa TaxID=46433 RepID=X6NPX4_RETFI|nr:hypothetical protein RFI_09368 [Reticulomyxa filosa]|eukprot:ETO27764.1 hypothetical protein RFI_09368 [Reticulomyxa filosa]
MFVIFYIYEIICAFTLVSMKKSQIQELNIFFYESMQNLLTLPVILFGCLLCSFFVYGYFRKKKKTTVTDYLTDMLPFHILIIGNKDKSEDLRNAINMILRLCYDESMFEQKRITIVNIHDPNGTKVINDYVQASQNANDDEQLPYFTHIFDIYENPLDEYIGIISEKRIAGEFQDKKKWLNNCGSTSFHLAMNETLRTLSMPPFFSSSTKNDDIFCVLFSRWYFYRFQFVSNFKVFGDSNTFYQPLPYQYFNSVRKDVPILFLRFFPQLFTKYNHGASIVKEGKENLRYEGFTLTDSELSEFMLLSVSQNWTHVLPLRNANPKPFMKLLDWIITYLNHLNADFADINETDSFNQTLALLKQKALLSYEECRVGKRLAEATKDGIESVWKQLFPGLSFKFCKSSSL